MSSIAFLSHGNVTMSWIITTTIILSALTAALCFNIDPVAWKTLTDGAAGFGYQVVQRRQPDLLVSAPLAQYSSRDRGQLFRCSTDGSCRKLQVTPPEFAVNMSLGLTMTNDPTTQKTLACGPTIPKDCRSITMYKGACFEIKRFNTVGPPVPSSIENCQDEADIAFLLDGSGSVYASDFSTMKKFVKNLITSIPGKETKFAIAQFSSYTKIHYYFNTFNTNDVTRQINGIGQLNGGTNTAAAIRNVVQNIFSSSSGSRPDVKKVLIVITDGESTDGDYLKGAIQLAERQNIVRFAIGVGSAFSSSAAMNELRTIASSPSKDHVFQVQNFNALEVIRQNLQNKIFSIEGTQSGGESLKTEMSQEGFSAAYLPTGFQLGTVGVNQWRGGYTQYGNDKSSSFDPGDLTTDSYLGYSMAVARTARGWLTIVGAPRYQHRGAVMTVDSNGRLKRIEASPYQSGEYFGAEVCAMDVDRDTKTDLILISAPMHVDTDREGWVYVCGLSGLIVECPRDSPVVLKGAESDRGRFGSSLAVLPDLNKDDLNDLAVGAPLENDGQGSIYIFHGRGRGKINLDYSQRIAGSEVKSGLRFFGMSISQSSFDLSRDGLPDLAVGSKGKVVLLRSKPIVEVTATVSFKPSLIPTQNTDCSKPLSGEARICFLMTTPTVQTANARINYTFTLDATRNVPNNRAYIQEKQRTENRAIDLTLAREACNRVKFFIQSCPEDALNALSNELKFIFEGLPSGTNLPSPSLALQSQEPSIHDLLFEINCGTDNTCIDNLKVDFNFGRSSEVRVGIDELLNVTVTVENREEDSYNSLVTVTYPVGLSYRKFTILQGKIECNSVDSPGGKLRGKTDCSIDKPIFKSNKKVSFVISYGIENDNQLARIFKFTANATSGNQGHSSSSELYMEKQIVVKNSIFISIDSSLSYTNFSFGRILQKPVQQSIVVTNSIRALNFTVVIRVPVKLGTKDIWADPSSLQFPDCQQDKDEEPTVTDFAAEIQKNKIVNCTVARCRLFKCTTFMGFESKTYIISGNLSSQWLEQIGLQSAKYLLTSTASLEYDQTKYIFFSAATNNTAPVRKIEAEVEVYTEPDFTKEIVGGSLGGLAVLALITAGLYKAGFFKSKYQEMISESAGEAGAPATDGAPPAPE